MTLKEFGMKILELYPIYKDMPIWITADDMTIQLWLVEPKYIESDDYCYWESWGSLKDLDGDSFSMFLYNPIKYNDIDLSEYKTESGKYDYSKCIEKLN